MPLTTSIAILLAACLGNTVLWIGHHNWWYAFPWRKNWPADVVHVLHALVLLGFPLVFVLRLIADPAAMFDFSTVSSAILSCYIVLCCIMGVVGFPAITLRRHRRHVALLRSNDTVPRDLLRE